MKTIFLLLLVPLFSVMAYAETQTLSTEKGTLDIRLDYGEIKPDEQTKIRVDFLNPTTGNIQEHIDYTIEVAKDGKHVFGPIPLTHTSLGTVSIPVNFKLGDGIYTLDFIVEGILFQPLPPEHASFDIVVGNVIPSWIKHNAGWWADGTLDDATFVTSLEYLIQNGILMIPNAQESSPDESVAYDVQIPPWIKNNAGWWAEGLIDDDAFVVALQYLIGQGIIRV